MSHACFTPFSKQHTTRGRSLNPADTKGMVFEPRAGSLSTGFFHRGLWGFVLFFFLILFQREQNKDNKASVLPGTLFKQGKHFEASLLSSQRLRGGSGGGSRGSQVTQRQLRGSREVVQERAALSAAATAWQGHCLQITESSCAPTAPAQALR